MLCITKSIGYINIGYVTCLKHKKRKKIIPPVYENCVTLFYRCLSYHVYCSVLYNILYNYRTVCCGAPMTSSVVGNVRSSEVVMGGLLAKLIGC